MNLNDDNFGKSSNVISWNHLHSSMVKLLLSHGVSRLEWLPRCRYVMFSTVSAYPSGCYYINTMTDNLKVIIIGIDGWSDHVIWWHCHVKEQKEEEKYSAVKRSAHLYLWIRVQCITLYFQQFLLLMLKGPSKCLVRNAMARKSA